MKIRVLTEEMEYMKKIAKAHIECENYTEAKDVIGDLIDAKRRIVAQEVNVKTFQKYINKIEAELNERG